MQDDALTTPLLQAVLGLWIAAGFADWICHRRTGIERTSGTAESLCHWLLLAQMGVAVLLCVAFRPGALLLAVLLLLWLSHQATTYLELRWVAPVRSITPAEQMMHSFLEVLPVAGMLLLAVPLAEAWQRGDAPAWALHARAPGDIAWKDPVWAGLALCCVAFNGLPYLEETWRCLRWRRRPTPRA